MTYLSKDNVAHRSTLLADRILKEFPSDLARLWIVADPDNVLLDEHESGPRLGGDGAQHREQLLHDDRCQTEAHLVDEEQPGSAADGASRYRLL